MPFSSLVKTRELLPHSQVEGKADPKERETVWLSTSSNRSSEKHQPLLEEETKSVYKSKSSMKGAVQLVMKGTTPDHSLVSVAEQAALTLATYGVPSLKVQAGWLTVW